MDPRPPLPPKAPQSNRQAAVLVGVFAVLALVLAGWGVSQLGFLSATPKPTSSPLAKALPTPTPALDPIQIAAMRARTYPGGQIIQSQDLGGQNGYHNAIVSFPSDGLTEYALMSTPDGVAPTGGWPMIILLHGYIDPAQYQTAGTDYRTYIATFARAGFVVVKPDFRGHGQSQGEPSGGHFSPAYAYDTLNLIASLKQYGGVNPARIGLFGHSLGAHAALRTIVVSPDVKATVFMSGVVGSLYDILYNWPHSPMSNDRPKVVVSGARQALIDKYGDPKTNPTFWDSASAINFVTNITGAVQINHSVGDTDVPVTFSQNLEAALKKAGKPEEAFYYPGDDHQFTANQATFLARALAFYQAHL